MPLSIQNILPKSLAARQGIKSSEILLTINNHPIRDFIDLQFYSSEEVLSCLIQDEEGKLRTVRIERKDSILLGIEPEEYKCLCCCNRCVFCFIDQLPPNLRDTLYLKDDDYLFSFVFGNYISLTNLDCPEYSRIFEQKLSPLYISVHSTNPTLRRKMMGYKQDFPILTVLDKLTEKGISYHTQVVIIPEWNDHEELQRTITDLINPRLSTLSVGIVPVGLTKYRRDLPKLRLLTPREAGQIISQTDELRIMHNTDKIFCADELYINADLPIPAADYYQDYPQLENGIGMLSLMLQNWQDKRSALQRELKKKNKPVLLVTGCSAAGYVKQIAGHLAAKLECSPVRVIPVKNMFLGESVTVSGLLTFGDIREQVIPRNDEIIILPGNIFNHEGITLDGYSQLEIKEFYQRDLMVVDPLFEDWEWI